MKASIFRLLIILITSFTLATCGLPYCEKTQLNESELQWANVYNNTDTIYFLSRQSIDTLYITKKTINNPRNTFIFDLEQGWSWLEGNNTYYANASLEYTLHHSDSTYQGVLMVLQKNGKKSSPTISFGFGGWYSNEITTDSLRHCVLNNNSFDDCIIINHSNVHAGKHQDILDLDYFIWSKSNGLIEYKLKDGEIFQLCNL